VRLARRRNGDNNGKVPPYDFTLKHYGLWQVKEVDVTCKYLSCQCGVAEDPKSSGMSHFVVGQVVSDFQRTAVPLS
jgi:hypothetical protein